MQRKQLETVLEWAYGKIQESDHCVREFYEYMKLIDSLETIIHLMKDKPEVILQGRRVPYLRVVDDHYVSNHKV